MKIFWSSILGAALATVSASANAGVFYSSIPDLTVAPNVAEGACSTCISSGLQWAGEEFSLSSTETVRSIEFAVAAATFPTSVTLGFYGVGGSMSVGAQVGSNFTLSTASYETITPGSQPTNLVTAYLAGGGQTLDAGSYLLFITNPIDLALPEYLNDGKGIFIVNQPLADGATYKPIGNGFDLGVALSNSVPEASTWAMMVLGFAGLGFAGYARSQRPSRLPPNRVPTMSARPIAFAVTSTTGFSIDERGTAVCLSQLNACPVAAQASTRVDDGKGRRTGD